MKNLIIALFCITYAIPAISADDDCRDYCDVMARAGGVIMNAHQKGYPMQKIIGTYSGAGDTIDELISVYPNPANKFVNIQLKSSEQINSIVLYNILGKLIYKENKPNNSEAIKIDISNFGKGIYFLKVNFTNNKTISKKLILN